MECDSCWYLPESSNCTSSNNSLLDILPCNIQISVNDPYGWTVQTCKHCFKRYKGNIVPTFVVHLHSCKYSWPASSLIAYNSEIICQKIAARSFKPHQGWHVGLVCGTSRGIMVKHLPAFASIICIKTRTINVHKPMGCMSAMSHPTQNCCISVIISIHLNKFICACFTASVEMSVLSGNMKRSPSEIRNCFLVRWYRCCHT